MGKVRQWLTNMIRARKSIHQDSIITSVDIESKEINEAESRDINPISMDLEFGDMTKSAFCGPRVNFYGLWKTILALYYCRAIWNAEVFGAHEEIRAVFLLIRTVGLVSFFVRLRYNRRFVWQLQFIYDSWYP